MKKFSSLFLLSVICMLSAHALDIPAGKFYFDNSKTQYSNVKFVYGNSTNSAYVVQMTNEGNNKWSVTIPTTATGMYRYTFANTSLADGRRNESFNTTKDYISNTLNEMRTATTEAEILVGGIFTPTTGENWTQGSWQTLAANSGQPYSGTLPVMFISTAQIVELPAVCTVVKDHYYAYYENTEGWANVHCYVWNENGQLAGNWTGEQCELVGTAENGNQIWRWVSPLAKTSNNMPANIIFNEGQQTGAQTEDLTFKNGGYYKYSRVRDEDPEVVLTGDGRSEEIIPITSKETYVQGTYYIDALGIDGYSDLGSAEEPLATQIKGRGNYTWTGFDKKPYRLKFDKKAQPLGMKKSKHFALLAHADDDLGFLRNTVGFQLSRLLGLEYTPEQQPVEVVLNGEYIGLYMLTDKLRVDEDRVNIVEQADYETDAEKITGGWLLEIDNYDEDEQIRITEGNGALLRFTYHTPELLSNEQRSYITNLVTKTDNAIYASNKNSTEWENYIDMDALARFYIIQEIMDNAESFHGSCYIHKEMGTDTKLVFGPVWDFGNSFHRGYNKFIYVDPPYGQNWIGEIAKFSRFQSKVKEIWQPFYGNEYHTLDAFIDSFVEQIAQAAVSDAQRWPAYGNSNMASRKTEFKNRIAQKTNYLRQQWGEGITGINNLTADTQNDGAIYTIEGKRVKSETLNKGIYIKNGKKFVVK